MPANWSTIHMKGIVHEKNKKFTVDGAECKMSHVKWHSR